MERSSFRNSTVRKRKCNGLAEIKRFRVLHFRAKGHAPWSLHNFPEILFAMPFPKVLLDG